MKAKGDIVSRMIVALAVFAVLFPSAPASASDTLTLTLFGPEAFFRTPSGPVLRNFTVPSTQGTFTLTLKNGDDAGNNKVSSATVKVNGATIARQSDFNQQVVWIIKPLTDLVPGSNTLSVEVSNKSSTSSFVTATITGDYLLNITIAVPTAGSEIFSDRTDVSGTYASYTSNLSVSVNGVGAQASTGTFSAANVPLLSGSNMITATIATSDGIQDNDTITVTANRAPVAAAGPDRIVTTGQTVVLDGRNSSDPENDLITYAWTFTQKPFGSASVLDNASSVNPSFVPDLNGIYIASLVVNDGHSNSAADSVTLTAEPPNTPPTANAGPDQSVVTEAQVYLDGRASFDPEEMPLYYSWSLLSVPTGSTAAFDDIASATPSFAADLDGDYLAQLIVNDGVHNSLPDNVLVVAATPNAPPVAYAGPDNTVLRTDIISLDGTGSYDPDNNALLFSWNIVSRPAGSTSELDNAAFPTPSLPADQEGDFVVRLTVNDGLVDSAPDTVVINSINAAPVADAGPDQTVPRNTSLTLDGSGSSDANNDPLTYSWSIISAPTGSTATIGNPTVVNPLFTSDQAGTYVIRLMVNDGHGGNAQDNVTMTATAPSVTVPNVVGTPQASAESAITGAGLAVGNITQAHSATVPAGNVISQNPAGGSTAYEGSYVDLTVSLGPVMVSVPNVVGMTQAAAQSAITAAGLTVGAVTQNHSATVPTGSVMSQSPAGGGTAPEGSAVDIVVSTGPAMVSVPHVLGMPQAQAQSSITGAGLAVGTVTQAYSETVAAGYVITENPAAGVTIVEGSAVSLTVSMGSAPTIIPPDPSTVAPSLDRTVATEMLSATSFLYTGANPIQTGVAPGTIELKRAAVVRGQVRAFDNTFLPGVKVTVLNHPEFGQTVSRTDGMFDMAVNGGGLLTFVYRKQGHISVQRRGDVPWQDYVALPDVVMISYDNQVTAIDLTSTAPVQIAQGSVVTDSDGTRQATLLFSQGTQAEAVFPDGSARPLPALSVRATEYTVGSNGPDAMPAPLPPTSGYTYAVELSVDEGISAGAAEIRFNQPVIYYVENFLGFPVGDNVPTGYYDRTKGIWVPSENGKVIGILSVTDGLADLDTDGDGGSDNAAVLAALGVTDTERLRLASLYTAGMSLWRVPVTHFSAWDSNWGFGPGNDAVAPTQPSPQTAEPTVFPTTECGTIIECEDQVLGDSIGIAGSPHTLNYRSSRVSGYALGNVFLSGETIPPTVKRIELAIDVAGQHFAQSFPAAPNQSTTFTWDGNDGYGRNVQGIKRVVVRIGYTYDGAYQRTSRFGYNGNGTFITGSKTRREVTLWQIWEKKIGIWDSKHFGFGAWTLGVHNAYDPVGKVIYLGDGTHRSAEAMPPVITTVAGTGARGYSGDDGPAKDAKIGDIRGLAVGPDGSLYLADQWAHRVRRVRPDGIITTVAGSGLSTNFPDYAPFVDNVPVLQAPIEPMGVALGPDGSLFIAEAHQYYGDDSGYRIRRVGPDGIISTVAGNGIRGYGGDGGPATEASFHFGSPAGLAVGPDGSLYIGDTNNNRLRRVDPNGIVTTMAGNGLPHQTVSDLLQRGPVPATQDWATPGALSLGPDGSLYFAGSWRHSVLNVGPDGVMKVVAGRWCVSCYIYDARGEGIPAASTTMGGMDPVDTAVGPDGSLYIADYTNHRIRYVSPDGIITTIAGNGVFGYSGDGGPATQAALYTPYLVEIGPDRSIFYHDYNAYRLRRIGIPFPGLSWEEVPVASEDGNDLYIFSSAGKHLRTLNALTGAVLYRFGYDSDGRLFQVFDSDNNVTTVERDGSGNPTIVAPAGQRTALVMNDNGYLGTVAGPAGNTVQFGYTPEGLLISLIDPNGYPHAFTYDTQGRLERDEDPEGGFKQLSRIDLPAGRSVDLRTAMGRLSTYRIERLLTGVTQRENTSPTGAVSKTLIGTDGKRTVTGTDNTVFEVTQGPDPRFGMVSPLASKVTVRTPGGFISTSTSTRGVTLSNPADPMSLLTQTDNVTVNGNAYRQVYNASQKQFTLTTPAGRTQIAGIDNQGRVVLLYPAPTVDNITFAYDGTGKMHQTVQGGKSWTYAYDSLNRLTTVTDPLDNVVQYGYDNADRVSRVILPSGRTYGFLHDNNGNLTQITMPSGVVHGLGYNKVNLDNAYVPPNNPAYGTGYNLDRDWVRTTLPSGRTIDGAYDNGGRLHDVTYPEGAVALSYFDNTDRVGTITRTAVPVPDNTTQTLSFSYDGFLTTRLAFSGVANGEYRYSFDNNFQIMSVALDNVWTTLSRDNDGLLTQYGPFTFTRNGPAGAPSALTDNTLNIGYTYDSSGRLWTRTHVVADQTVYGLVLAYDNVGRIRTKTETVSGTAHMFDYEYDLDGQLFQVRKDGALVEQYAYDNNANRTSTLANTATYDEQDRLIEQGGVNYTFDVDGYLTTRGSDTFTYSARGELLSATMGGQTITYQYDGMGRRVGKTDAVGTTQYLYGNPGNPFQVMASRDAAGNLTTYFYDTTGNLYAFVRGGQRFYVATDQLGTPKAVTDTTGIVIKVVEYDAWGVKLSDSNATFDLPIGFAGGIADGTMGLVRFGWRDYESGSGRWAAKDSILFRGGLNLFVYVENSPVNRTDRNGLGPVSEGILGGISQGHTESLITGLAASITTGVVLASTGIPKTAVWLISLTVGELGSKIGGKFEPSDEYDELAMIDAWNLKQRMTNDPEFAKKYRNDSWLMLKALIESGTPKNNNCSLNRVNR